MVAIIHVVYKHITIVLLVDLATHPLLLSLCSAVMYQNNEHFKYALPQHKAAIRTVLAVLAVLSCRSQATHRRHFQYMATLAADQCNQSECVEKPCQTQQASAAPCHVITKVTRSTTQTIAKVNTTPGIIATEVCS